MNFSLEVESSAIACIEKILGNTYSMCVLQDFEALTPNVLGRTTETVEGGGLIVLLLRSLPSLKSLYTMVMDVHKRFRTESHSLATPRFNERFALSLASCETCIVMNDEFQILPISSHLKNITAVPVQEDSEGLSEAERELRNLKEQLNEDFPVGPLIRECCTLDQGKAVITFLDAILDKTLRSTVALLAARCRGKSAALGLAIAGAVAAGYSNIYVTAPSPENLQTLFDFVCKGFTMLEYKEILDYNIVKSSNPEFKNSTVRINISKQHRQTIQYILPHEHEKLSQVELLVVDEAAAIPLPVVKSLIGPYLVFLASTVNGYEGTGRSLSLKLLQQLEEQSRTSNRADNALSGRLFKKIELSESIRYAPGDCIEQWLNSLLCLDVTNTVPSIRSLPKPADCDLYYVNRDTLFSHHKDSELFLQRMMALYVAFHYKNSPNDLQLMADAPAHHLFVLLGPVDESENLLPDILCVIQVCLEGQISRESARRALREGRQPFGEQIPWKFSQQFADDVFPSLSGARIVRIATNPMAMRMGYGSAAVEFLTRYFEGQLTQLSEVETALETPQVNLTEAAEEFSLVEENVTPRTDLPPLLVPLRERQPERLHYLGVSFELTLDLFRFWRRHKFAPFFIGNAPNSLTGEYSCMVLKALKNDDVEAVGSDEWGFYGPGVIKYKRRLVELFGSTYRKMNYMLAMSVFNPKINFVEQDPASVSSEFLNFLKFVLEPHEMKRLEAYTNSQIDHPLIRDVAQKLARMYFLEHLPVSLSYDQASILFCYGLQHKDISEIETKMEPHSISVDEDLYNAAKEVQDEMKAKSEGLLDPELFQQFAIVDREAEFGNALRNGGGKIVPGSVVSVESKKFKLEKHSNPETEKSGKKRSKDRSGLKSSKKRRS
ncbi:UPF0202 protein [Capsicum baccatum]|uniref:RNA cytidine acetyltransferase n=1 Tax=Capsicum baccatum TaxID=33114 RepID=A0A2G2W2Q1_CAPBA|nr:UPF0202 protein [Capsicum baccatum]